MFKGQDRRKAALSACAKTLDRDDPVTEVRSLIENLCRYRKAHSTKQNISLTHYSQQPPLKYAFPRFGWQDSFVTGRKRANSPKWGIRPAEDPWPPNAPVLDTWNHGPDRPSHIAAPSALDHQVEPARDDAWASWSENVVREYGESPRQRLRQCCARVPDARGRALAPAAADDWPLKLRLNGSPVKITWHDPPVRGRGEKWQGHPSSDPDWQNDVSASPKEAAL